MNLTELLLEYSIDFRSAGEHHHTTQGWVNLDCPFCSPGSYKFRLGIATSNLVCRCWVCGSHSISETFRELLRIPIRDCIDLLKQLGRDFTITKELLPGKLLPPKDIGPLLKPHRHYLHDRGFDPDHLEEVWGIGGIGLSSQLPWRIYIPVRQGTKVVSWTTRGLVNEGSRYINAKPEEEALPLKSLLYGAELAQYAIIVVEGPFDAFRIGPGAVATLGVTYTKAQLAKIARYPLRAIAFDNEPEAQKQAERLVEELSPFPGRTVRVEIDAADPGSASDKEVQQLRKTFLE